MVVAAGVDGVFGDYLAGVCVADGDGAVVDEYEYGFADVGPSDAEVADLAGVAEGDFAVLVDFVGALCAQGVFSRRWSPEMSK